MQIHCYSFFVSCKGIQKISLEWSVQDGAVRLSQIQLNLNVSQSNTPENGQDTLIPEEIASLVGLLQDYFVQGRELGPAPWSCMELSQLSQFQLRVFQAIGKIPHGETRTYGWVAQQLQKPFASRAVGQALKCNPFPILVPCHRVVSNTSVGGFMGSCVPEHAEVKLKKQLLRLEFQYRNPHFPFLIPTEGVA